MKKKFVLLTTFLTLSAAALACRLPLLSTPDPTTTSAAPQTEVPTATEPDLPENTATPEVVESPNLPAFNAPVIFNFEMFSPFKGWAITQDENHLLTTVDGGETWLEATPSVLIPVPAESASLSLQPFFLNETTAWFTPFTTGSGILYHTQDQGVSWTTTPLPFENARFQFLDLDNGFALVNLGAGAGSHYVALYRTSDGGASWTLIFTHEPGETKSLPGSGSKNGITFLDLDHGWIGGVIPKTDYFYLFSTIDGGVTWMAETEIALPAKYSESMLEVQPPTFLNDTTGFLPVTALDAEGNRFLLIYRSDDSGQTWTFKGAVEDGRAVDFVTPDLGWIVALNSLYQSLDGGATWSTMDLSGVPTGEFLLNLDFVDEQVGWVLSTPDEETWSPLNLYRTSDGGLTAIPLLP